MPYEIHDTAHVEKRAKERSFTLQQAIETINTPAGILKTPLRRRNQGGLGVRLREHSRAHALRVGKTAGGVIWMRRLFFALWNIAVVLSVRCIAANEDSLQKFAFEKAEMGVPFRITLFAENEETAK